MLSSKDLWSWNDHYWHSISLNDVVIFEFYYCNNKQCVEFFFTSIFRQRRSAKRNSKCQERVRQVKYPRIKQFPMLPVANNPWIPNPANNQVAPAPVAEQPTRQEYDPTYNPEYNPNQLPDDGCWTTQCLDMPQPTGLRVYCPQCQLGIDGRSWFMSHEIPMSIEGRPLRTNNRRRCIDPL